MIKYDLRISFTDAQLEAIYATNSNVIVAKPTEDSEANVAWQVFKPLQSNSLTWEEQYGIYVSTTSAASGARLEQLSSVPVGAAPDKLYTLLPSGVISGPAEGGAPDAFALQNKYQVNPYMTVGLYQNATVNGVDILGNALSAAPVLEASTAIMTPFTTVYVWLQSRIESNTIVTTVASPMTELKFGGGVDTIQTSYDTTTGKFLINQG
ncbi:MAG: hypothetical protein AAFR61_05320 [Bacteroidota bacterium]